MSYRARIIPVLLIQQGELVKTTKFISPRYIGDPINAIKIFNEKEVDEIVVLDIDASKKNQTINFDLIKDLASECFMPLSYGGGIKTLKEIEQLIKTGVEKVILNSSALENPALIKEATKQFGSSTIVVSIDITKSFFGNYILYSAAGKMIISSWKYHLMQMEDAGVGEILIQTVQHDGIMKGYDLKLIGEISRAVSIPVIACGGAGSFSDLRSVISSGASAAAAGSMFVYTGVHKAVMISYPSSSDMNW
ncbi:MAG: AglZ/HisF2 family acetamidino modification protein [Bacteroidota bacterium]